MTGATQHKAWAALYGATVTLSDTTPPTLGTPSGPLWEPGAYDGYHKGSESITMEAQDVGGGVQSIVLAADGQRLAAYEASCDFTYPQPCPSSTGPQMLTLQIGDLSDGTHTLTLVAVDAAGNESTLASKQITIDNTAPPAPLNLTATATQEGGSTFTATWSDPQGQVAPITAATYQLCPASGSGCTAPAAAPAAGPATVTVPAPGSWTLSVWLTDAAGNSSTANAARTTLIVPSSSGEGSPEDKQEGKSGGKDGGPGAGGGGAGSKGGTGPGSGSGHGGSPGSKVKLRLKARLRGHRLIVHLSGPAGRRAHVSYIARHAGRRVGHAAKTITLKHGKHTLTFTLRAKAVKHTTIRVSARAGRMVARARVRTRRSRRLRSH